jgi:hypothetical protein
MFVYDFVTLERPYEEVAGALTDDRGAGVLTRAVVAAANGSGGDQLRLEVGGARPIDSGVVIPIRWTPGSDHAPFRHLDGSLHIEPMEGGASHVSLSASYDEPLSGLGRREDSRRRQRQAETTVRSFLREFAGAIEGAQDQDSTRAG